MCHQFRHQSILLLQNLSVDNSAFSNYIKLKSQVSDFLQQRLESILESKIPYEIRVTASNGTSFKNNEGESEITVELLKSGITQEAEFLFKDGDSIVGKGTKFLVKSSDFEGLFNLTISAYIGNEEVATKQVSFTNTVEPTILVIKTSSGNIFKNNIIHTALTATLWRGDKEIDKNGTDFSYIWTKTDAEGEPDVIWNQDHSYSQKTIEITQKDVFRRAQFECNVEPIG